ncbi:hypothetical protein [Aliikangiella maris]|uniref:Uncharacterized protein n=2 Tax=Aliikangiella maris TaxID=3162458 RepID=A0ABV3MKJ0_9GAMM
MKVASRFPIKNCPFILGMIIAIHWGFKLSFVLAYYYAQGWQLNSVNLELLSYFWLLNIINGCSLVACLIRLQQITHAPDDLCWNGESWLINANTHLNRVEYLTLQSQTWVTRYGCLLHLQKEQGIATSNTDLPVSIGLDVNPSEIIQLSTKFPVISKLLSNALFNRFVLKHLYNLRAQFAAKPNAYYWLFTASGLGERSYRELCYLVLQDRLSQQSQHPID